MNQNLGLLYNVYYKMCRSLSKDEIDGWLKLMFSKDSGCRVLGTELFNSFENTNFDYLLIMNQLISYRYA